MISFTSSIWGLNICVLFRLISWASSDFETSSMPLIKMPGPLRSDWDQESASCFQMLLLERNNWPVRLLGLIAILTGTSSSGARCCSSWLGPCTSNIGLPRVTALHWKFTHPVLFPKDLHHARTCSPPQIPKSWCQPHCRQVSLLLQGSEEPGDLFLPPCLSHQHLNPSGKY